MCRAGGVRPVTDEWVVSFALHRDFFHKDYGFCDCTRPAAAGQQGQTMDSRQPEMARVEK